MGGGQGTRAGSGGVSEGARARDREKTFGRAGGRAPNAGRAPSDASSRPAWPFRRETRSLPRARGVGSGRARTSFSAKSSMSMITSRLCAVRPAILDAASPSTMIVGESTAVDLGVHSLEDAREDLAPALALFGRAADANTALLATQEAIFSACEEKRTATCALRYAGVRGGARDTSNRNLVGRRHCFTRGRAKNSSREPSMTSRFGFSRLSWGSTRAIHFDTSESASVSRKSDLCSDRRDSGSNDSRFPRNGAFEVSERRRASALRKHTSRGRGRGRGRGRAPARSRARTWR